MPNKAILGETMSFADVIAGFRNGLLSVVGRYVHADKPGADETSPQEETSAGGAPQDIYIRPQSSQDSRVVAGIGILGGVREVIKTLFGNPRGSQMIRMFPTDMPIIMKNTDQPLDSVTLRLLVTRSSGGTGDGRRVDFSNAEIITLSRDDFKKTMFRSTTEQKLQSVMNRAARGPVILMVPDIDFMVEGGGGLSLMQSLLGELDPKARANLRIVGTTTRASEVLERSRDIAKETPIIVLSSSGMAMTVADLDAMTAKIKDVSPGIEKRLGDAVLRRLAHRLVLRQQAGDFDNLARDANGSLRSDNFRPVVEAEVGKIAAVVERERGGAGDGTRSRVEERDARERARTGARVLDRAKK